ncbi:EAL domain-containing response regulator [Derxia gummosa]|uniref:EAL domain-containing response regulator n=1 Tax=Derxia gummosa DSM 723 TaxID=1121388 RepID=A0A8B6X197_9BURK|nr:EAL domain-containing response regulator [Derxia gummosa]
MSARPADSAKVLVVDDDRFQRRTLARQLRAAGAADVAEAEDGNAALAWLHDHGDEAWLALCDLDMPGMDGLELVRHFDTANPRGAIALLSAHDADVLRSASLLGGGDSRRLLGTWAKPLASADLADIFMRWRLLAGDSLLLPDDAGADTCIDVSELRAALERGAVVAWLQPKIELATGAVVGAEALARLDLGAGGVMLPGQFWHQVASDGRELETTLTMVGQLGRALPAILARREPFVVALNLALDSIAAAEALPRLSAAVEAAGIGREHLMFEITESAAAVQSAIAAGNVARLRMRGFRLSIDDFGTGHSTLDQLYRLPFSELKLDRSFVQQAMHDRTARAMVQSTLQLARTLGLSTVAEGVEDEATALLLRELGCDCAQGWLFAPAMPPEEFVRWLDRHADARAMAAFDARV